VRNTAPVALRKFGRADVEEAVDLDRVAIDDLAREFRRNTQGEFGLSTPGGSGYGDQGILILTQRYGFDRRPQFSVIQ
jgi:hypothetical protein